MICALVLRATQVEEILTPQGCIKGDHLGPQLWAEKGSAATVVSGRNYVQNVHIADTATTPQVHRTMYIHMYNGGPSVHQHYIL